MEMSDTTLVTGKALLFIVCSLVDFKRGFKNQLILRNDKLLKQMEYFWHERQ